MGIDTFFWLVLYFSLPFSVSFEEQKFLILMESSIDLFP